MRKTNDRPALGSLFTTGAALVSPAHELITRRPLYDIVAPVEGPSPIRSLISRLAAELEGWRQRRSQRISLGALDDRLLDDIGFDQLQTDEKRKKPFWR